jgi:hypothetical protein
MTFEDRQALVGLGKADAAERDLVERVRAHQAKAATQRGAKRA